MSCPNMRLSCRSQQRRSFHCGCGWMMIGVLALIQVFFVQISRAEYSLSSASIKLFGSVRDLGGAPIQDVFVSGTHIESGFSVGTKTNEQGYYELYVEQGGAYSIDAFRCNWSKSPYVNDYIPDGKTIEIGSVPEVNVDFRLRPAGNIILHAYDNQGKLLRNKRLETATSGHWYVTDMKSMPHYGSYRPLHDAYTVKHGYNWELLLPSFVVSPGVDHAVHLLWEIPEFGKVTVSIDNEGKGYNVLEQGGAVILNFNHEAAKSKLAALQRDYDL
jgi:hypothetical protein